MQTRRRQAHLLSLARSPNAQSQLPGQQTTLGHNRGLNTKQRTKIATLDAYVAVTAEYNHGIQVGCKGQRASNVHEKLA
jgi:hypothetical protein